MFKRFNLKQNKLVKSDFTRNVLTLMTGTTVAQAIPVAISPILTRIYTPEDFGLFAIFIAISSIFGSIANGRYELAIMLPRKDEDAINIFALGFIITSIISIVLLIIVILFNDYFIKLLDNENIGLWLYFIPFSVFFIGIYNILNYFNNRKKNYKDIARALILKSIVLSIVQLSIGFFKNGTSGLITGEILSRMFSNMRLLKNIINDKLLISTISLIKIIALAKKYKDFPKFSMWAILANTLSSHLTSILISIYYNIATLGFYSLSERLLGAPIALIGKSISQVFFQEAVQEDKDTGTIKKTFNNTLKKLVFVGFPIFFLLFCIVEDLFAFVFGENWRIAGMYSQYLIILFFARFIVSPLTMVPIILGKNKIDYYFQVIMLILLLLIFTLSQILKLNFENFLILFSICYGSYYLLYLMYLKKLIDRSIS